MINSNIEYRNPKQCLNFLNSNALNKIYFGYLKIRISDLFRASDFGFRIFLITTFCLLSSIFCSFAQEQNLEQVANSYFKNNEYNEFVEYLKPLAEKDKTKAAVVNYYLALTRYNQLRHLEETQAWDEYFSQGNDYRDQIVAGTQKAIEETKPLDGLNIYARLLSWQFHKDQEDNFSEGALLDLMNAVSEYAKSTGDPKIIKEVADKLSSYQEKAKAKELYKVYVEKITTSNTKDKTLSEIAANFYKEGNLELAETIYDAYLDKISQSMPSEKLTPILTEIAKKFAYKDEGNKDMLYAEKIFQKLEDLGGQGALSEELEYLRAFNLEKAKEYQKAKDAYLVLIQRYPLSGYADEAIYKVGIINTYILKDKLEGMSYFEKLAQREKKISPQVISSLYQLGLLNQWENNLDKAKDFYNRLINMAGEDFPETLLKARERLEEIKEARPLEYNLKRFLDACLNAEYADLDMTKSELKAAQYNLAKGQEVNIASSVFLPASGCTQIELQYLWAGDTGKNLPSVNEASFNTAYNELGTKFINLIVVSPTGIFERSIDLIDVRSH